MASKTEKPKADATPKKEAAVKADSPAAKDGSKGTPKDTAKDAPKAESADTAAAVPSNYSRGEGQKPVSAAYRENWNAIFGKKAKKKKKH